MIQEKNFEAYITDNGMVVFAIEAKKGIPSKAKIEYAGGQHALLYRSDALDDVVILDYLHPQIQKQLSQSDTVFVAEIDYIDEKITCNYDAPVEQVVELAKFQIDEMK